MFCMVVCGDACWCCRVTFLDENQHTRAPLHLTSLNHFVFQETVLRMFLYKEWCHQILNEIFFGKNQSLVRVFAIGLKPICSQLSSYGFNSMVKVLIQT